MSVPNTRRDNPSWLCDCGCKCPCGCWTCADGYHCAGEDCPHEDGREMAKYRIRSCGRWWNIEELDYADGIYYAVRSFSTGAKAISAFKMFSDYRTNRGRIIDP